MGYCTLNSIRELNFSNMESNCHSKFLFINSESINANFDASPGKNLNMSLFAFVQNNIWKINSFNFNSPTTEFAWKKQQPSRA